MHNLNIKHDICHSKQMTKITSKWLHATVYNVQYFTDLSAVFLHDVELEQRHANTIIRSSIKLLV